MKVRWCPSLSWAESLGESTMLGIPWGGQLSQNACEAKAIQQAGVWGSQSGGPRSCDVPCWQLPQEYKCRFGKAASGFLGIFDCQLDSSHLRRESQLRDFPGQTGLWAQP